MTDKWQLYSQTGVDGPEYGIRIRPGYVVVGFQLEDARQIVAWQNASIQPEGDILERAKKAIVDDDMTYEDYNECISLLIAEVEAKNDKIAQNAITIQMHHENALTLQKEVGRLRSENDRAERAHESLDYMRRHEIAAKDARIKELEADKLMYEDIAESYQIGVDNLRAYIKRMEEAFLEAKRCPTCNGAGKLIDVVISRKLGRVESERVCPLCEGKWEEKAREALEEIRSSEHISDSTKMIRAGGKDERL